MITIGVDPSINSTGICVNKDGKFTYYLVVSHMTKKMQDFQHKYIKYLPYNKSTNDKDLTYSQKEYIKTMNVTGICEEVKSVISKIKPDHIYMEGISYGSVGSSALADLAGLNFALRYVYINKGIPFTIVSPSQNKKFATGNGAADKNLMIDSWKRLDKNIQNVTEVKIDDLADSYFLSCYQGD